MALRTAKFLDEFLTRPGLIVLLVTGLWMAATRWTLSHFWIRLALLMVVIVLVALYIAVGPPLGRLIRVAETDGIASKRWARSEARFEIIGGASGLIIIKSPALSRSENNNLLVSAGPGCRPLKK